MKDIGLFIVADGTIDLVVENGDLKGDEGLETSALISMFTDQRIRDDEVPPGEISKRGWWADMFAKIDNDVIGSKLWLYDRSKITLSNMTLIQDQVEAAFAWMLQDGVADSVSATVLRDGTYGLKITVQITRPSGQADKYSVLWDTQSKQVKVA